MSTCSFSSWSWKLVISVSASWYLWMPSLEAGGIRCVCSFRTARRSLYSASQYSWSQHAHKIHSLGFCIACASWGPYLSYFWVDSRRMQSNRSKALSQSTCTVKPLHIADPWLNQDIVELWTGLACWCLGRPDANILRCHYWLFNNDITVCEYTVYIATV